LLKEKRKKKKEKRKKKKEKINGGLAIGRKK
jgi:hypothetical protein